MKRLLGSSITFLSLLFVGNASAAIVTDVNGTDLNVITTVTSILDPEYTPTNPRTGVNIAESYGENSLVFDKTIEIEDSDDWANGWSSLYVNLQVTNDTNYAWSGYKVEFWNADFTSSFPITLLSVNLSPYFGNDIFDQSTGFSGGTEIIFWSDTIRQNPGETNNVWFRWDWGNPLDYQGPGTVLGVRQIASVVPIPAALPLFGSALGLMGFLGWKRKKTL